MQTIRFASDETIVKLCVVKMGSGEAQIHGILTTTFKMHLG